MKPRLYVFTISHYCEKARWALDCLGIDYDLVFTVPGLHLRLARSLNLPATSLPVLVAGSDIIQGSSAIIDWAESRSESAHSLTPPAVAEQCRDYEARLDERVGVHTRRYFYSEALLEHPARVKSVFLIEGPLSNKIFLNLMWPYVRGKMSARMDLGPSQGEESRQILAGELDWLDVLLEDGRPYLAGEIFTRADITASALLARVAGAQEHPYARQMFAPPRMETQLREWHTRPCLAWIRSIYHRHRRERV